jgi:glycosyltransferase involved in cell wall biosynthesis
MPIYNCGLFIGEAIESILEQTFRDLELIIIDDSSTDNTLQVVSSFKDDRIRLIEKKENTGLISSLNLGIQMSRGAFIARMDGDDISHTTRIEKQIQFLKANPEIMLCGTWYQLLSLKEIIKLPVEPGDIKIALLDYCPLGHPTVMFRKDILAANNLSYDPDFFAAEDYELWTRMVAIGSIANIPAPLLSYRSHPNQVSAKEQLMQVKNSRRCRVRMLCYPLGVPTNSDIKASLLIVGDEKVSNFSTLVEIINWLNHLNEKNKTTAFYLQNKFEVFIKKKKSALVRTFYLNTSSYNPGVLLNFIGSGEKFSSYFTRNEYLRLAIKCLVYWK